MSFNILEATELIAEVSGAASGETQLEVSLEKIVAAWASTEFTTRPYREQKHVYILGGLDEVMVQLEDHQVMLQTMLASRYISGVREQVELWDKRLALLSETLDEWISCQKQWMYLETIFGAEDIQRQVRDRWQAAMQEGLTGAYTVYSPPRQLPSEAMKFTTVDKKWKARVQSSLTMPPCACVHSAIAVACSRAGNHVPNAQQAKRHVEH